jgi:hypothetical protein
VSGKNQKEEEFHPQISQIENDLNHRDTENTEVGWQCQARQTDQSVFRRAANGTERRLATTNQKKSKFIHRFSQISQIAFFLNNLRKSEQSVDKIKSSFCAMLRTNRGKDAKCHE